VGGLQAGLGYPPGQKRAYSHGETIRLVVRVRNVGKEELKFQYLRQFFIERPPIVTDADGKAVRQWKMDVGGFGHVPEELSLARSTNAWPARPRQAYGAPHLAFGATPRSSVRAERRGRSRQTHRPLSTHFADRSHVKP
jgi:hypothetical protein